MIREYEQGLRFSEYVTEGAHGRTGAFMTTNDYDVVGEKVRLGWSFELPRMVSGLGHRIFPLWI